jgi:CDP-diacylglycerol--glycerol-3-phosphate 3-phosphatidyltransferase
VNWALALTLLRLALAPVVVALGLTRGGGAAVAVLLVVGFLSDVFDGVVARRTGTATPILRRLDSTVDTVFYLGIAVAAWMLHRAEIRPLLPLILLVIATELGTNALCWLRFRREASYHAWSARMFGLALFAALLMLFAAGSPALLLPAIVVGLVSHLENAAITLVLPEWRYDVRSLFVAWQIRQGRARAAG